MRLASQHYWAISRPHRRRLTKREIGVAFDRVDHEAFRLDGGRACVGDLESLKTE
jgi:hypothetical protein